MAVPPVRAEHVVIVAQTGPNARRDGFLSLAGMQGPEEVPGEQLVLEKLLHLQLEATDKIHHPQHVEHGFFGDINHRLDSVGPLRGKSCAKW